MDHVEMFARCMNSSFVFRMSNWKKRDGKREEQERGEAEEGEGLGS